MELCCIESLALKGFADLTPEGGGYTCDRCGRYYQIVNGQWRDAYRCPRCLAVSFNPTDRRERYCGRCHAFEAVGGGFYGRVTPSGPLVPVGTTYTGPVDAWICRRVADFAPAPIPTGAAFDVCTRCAVAIVFNPARRVTAPKICMQCAHYQPLPIVSQA